MILVLMVAVMFFPQRTFAYEPIPDPSLIPLPVIPEETFRTGERYRFIVDFNFDGINDLALSHDIGLFGNAGGNFTFYKGNTEHKYVEIGSIFAHPDAVALKKDQDGHAIIITYWHLSSASGHLIEYSIGDDTITEISQRLLYPGDGGKKEDQEEYNQLFHSEKRLYAEKSITKDGVVTWKSESFPEKRN